MRTTLRLWMTLLWIVDRREGTLVGVAKGTYRRLIGGFLGNSDFGSQGEEHVQ